MCVARVRWSRNTSWVRRRIRTCGKPWTNCSSLVYTNSLIFLSFTLSSLSDSHYLTLGCTFLRPESTEEKQADTTTTTADPASASASAATTNTDNSNASEQQDLELSPEIEVRMKRVEMFVMAMVMVMVMVMRARMMVVLRVRMAACLLLLLLHTAGVGPEFDNRHQSGNHQNIFKRGGRHGQAKYSMKISVCICIHMQAYTHTYTNILILRKPQISRGS